MKSRRLRPSEIAADLAVDIHNVLAWINAGHLPAVNVSNGTKRPRWRVKPVDLDAFLEKREAKPRRKTYPTPRKRTLSGVIEFF